MTQEDQVFIINVVVIHPTQEKNAISQLTNVVAKLNAIIKIRKCKGFHERHHFIPMAMDVH